MTYLSFELINSVITAVPKEGISIDTKFKQTGTVFCNTYGGFNAQVFGAEAPNGKLVFQKIPIGVTGWDKEPASDFGLIEKQDDGTVAIQWPVK